jgi:hypothetical protein
MKTRENPLARLTMIALALAALSISATDSRADSLDPLQIQAFQAVRPGSNQGRYFGADLSSFPEAKKLSDKLEGTEFLAVRQKAASFPQSGAKFAIIAYFDPDQSSPSRYEAVTWVRHSALHAVLDPNEEPQALANRIGALLAKSQAPADEGLAARSVYPGKKQLSGTEGRAMLNPLGAEAQEGRRSGGETVAARP